MRRHHCYKSNHRSTPPDPPAPAEATEPPMSIEDLRVSIKSLSASLEAVIGRLERLEQHVRGVDTFCGGPWQVCPIISATFPVTCKTPDNIWAIRIFKDKGIECRRLAHE